MFHHHQHSHTLLDIEGAVDAASSAPVAASSAPAVEQSPPHSLLPSASAAAGGRLCSAGSLQLCCLRRPE